MCDAASRARYIKRFVGNRAGEETRFFTRAGLQASDDSLGVAFRSSLFRDFTAADKVRRASCAALVRCLTPRCWAGDAWLPQEKVLRMCEENMRALYEASWGWDAKSKKAELSHVAARYIAAVDAGGELVGYVHFRFAWDDDDDPEEVVGYIYELQILPSWQGRGLGKKLVEYVKRITSAYGLKKCMLTCLKANTQAMAFYSKVGFSVDSSSPSQFDEDECYEILSLSVV